MVLTSRKMSCRKLPINQSWTAMSPSWNFRRVPIRCTSGERSLAGKTMTERIDAHHHLWRYKKEDYHWIGAGMKALARDFLPADLERELAASGIHGSIAVQARQTLEETDWLLQHAGNSQAIRGVVGWAPIADQQLLVVLDRLQQFKKLKGLR